MRLAFMGTPDFAVDILRALITAGHEIAMVYCQPPSRSGRGKKEHLSPVHQLARSLNIPVHCPKSLKDDHEQQKFAALDLDLAVVAAYGLLLPKAVLEAPKYGCLNIHTSLLPRWRGAAPIQRAIMAGDRQTGISIMVMTAGLDTGPVIMQRQIPILATDTAGRLQERLQALGADMIAPALDGYVAGNLTPTDQAGHGITYAAKITKQEARIDWSRSAADIRNHIHGLNPFPGAYSMVGDIRIKMLTAEVAEVAEVTKGGDGPAGCLLAAPMIIACGDHRALKILSAQRAGKGPMTAEALGRGLHLVPGTCLT